MISSCQYGCAPGDCWGHTNDEKDALDQAARSTDTASKYYAEIKNLRAQLQTMTQSMDYWKDLSGQWRHQADLSLVTINDLRAQLAETRNDLEVFHQEKGWVATSVVHKVNDKLAITTEALEYVGSSRMHCLTSETIDADLRIGKAREALAKLKSMDSDKISEPMPDTSIPESMCVCGHRASQHLYHDGECRSGVKCENECRQFLPVHSERSAPGWKTCQRCGDTRYVIIEGVLCDCPKCSEE